MKIQIEQKDLAKLISKVARAAAVTSTLPALQGMKLTAANGKLVAQATDLEIGVRLDTAEIQVHEEGEVLVPARNFEIFVKNLPSEVITLEVSDNKLMVKYGRSKANLNLITDTDYPSLPECKDEILTIPGSALRRALARVLPAVAKTHFRQVFTGVLLDIQEGKTVFVGSDTHRLNIYEVNAGGKPQQIIIPARAVDEILRLVDDEGAVVVLTNGNNLLLKTGEVEIASRIIDGVYPNYLQVIPSAFVTEANINTSALKQSLQRLLTLPKAGDQVHTTRIALNGTIEISSVSDTGEIKEILETEKTGEDLVISFNSSYLMDAVKLMPEETKISFSGSLSPALLKGEDGFLSVLVPLRAVQ
jgi:DNA polymerase-3 subunit beta